MARPSQKEAKARHTATAKHIGIEGAAGAMSGRSGLRWRSRLPVGLLAALLIAASLPTMAIGQPWVEPVGEGVAFIHPDLRDAVMVEPSLKQEVIVTHRDDPGQAAAALDQLGLKHRTLVNVGASLVRADAAGLDLLGQQAFVRGVWPNEPVQWHLNEAGPIVNATMARQAHDVSGEGVGVLMIDSGVDALHPDLASRVVQNAQPVLPFEDEDGDFIEDLPFNDWFGHGTHVAGIVAGTGEGLGSEDPNHARFVGIAPGVDMIAFSLSSPTAAETPVGYTWTALNGYEYALQKQDEYNIRVITNSWGSTGAYAPDHPVALATLKAYQEGMAVVFSAGNEGEAEDSEDHTLNQFATLEWTVGVAASDKQGDLADFSSRGQDPNVTGRAWDHPTITAPGDPVMAAKSRAGVLQATSPTESDEFPGEPVAQATHYQYSRGTSMAAPMVSGALALMLEANPDLAPDQLYDILVATAKPFGDYAYWETGAGMLDAHAAVDEALETNGTRDAFLQGDRRYDEPFMHQDEPLKRHLFPVAEATDARVEGAPADAVEAPAASLILVVPALGALIFCLRRPRCPW